MYHIIYHTILHTPHMLHICIILYTLYYIIYIIYVLYIMYTQRTMYTYIYNVILDFFIFTLSIKLIYICRPELFISPNHLFNVFMSHKKLRNYSVLEM